MSIEEIRLTKLKAINIAMDERRAIMSSSMLAGSNLQIGSSVEPAILPDLISRAEEIYKWLTKEQ